MLLFSSQPSRLTSAGRYAAMLDALPSTVDKLVGVIQGLGIYDMVAGDFSGCTIPASRQDEIHLRSMEKMLEQLLALDNQPLTEARTVDKRLACRCHNLTRFLVAMLRAKRIPPARDAGSGRISIPDILKITGCVNTGTLRRRAGFSLIRKLNHPETV